MGAKRARSIAVWALVAVLMLAVVPLAAPPAAAAEETKTVYEVEEIEPTSVDTTTWESVSLLDDMGIGYDIPPMPFYDLTVHQFWVVSNGFVALGDYDGRGGTTGCCQGGTIPSNDGENGLVAAAWTDLDPSSCGQVKRSFTDDRFRVAFIDVPYFGENCLDLDYRRASFRIEAWRANGTFEVHLFEADGGIQTTSGIEDTFGEEGNQTRRTSASLADPVAWRFTRTQITVPDEPLEQDDAGSGGDAGDDQSQALAIVPGDYTGTLDPDFNDTEDWYAFEASVNDTIDAIMDPVRSTANFDLELYDPDGTLLASSNRPGSQAETLSATAPENGTYALRVFALAGEGDYTFSVDVGSAPPPPPPPVDPRVETFVFRGDIDCALVAGGLLATGDLCDRWVPESPDRPTRFDLGIDRGATSVHVEVRWDPDDALLGASRMAYGWAGFSGELAGDEGFPPIVHDQTIGSDVSWQDTGRVGSIGVEVSHLAAGPAVVGQPFTLCVAVMYGGAGLPADYACEA